MTFHILSHYYQHDYRRSLKKLMSSFKRFKPAKSINLVIVIDYSPNFDDTGIKVEFHAFGTTQEPQQRIVCYSIPGAGN